MAGNTIAGPFTVGFTESDINSQLGVDLEVVDIPPFFRQCAMLVQMQVRVTDSGTANVARCRLRFEPTESAGPLSQGTPDEVNCAISIPGLPYPAFPDNPGRSRISTHLRARRQGVSNAYVYGAIRLYDSAALNPGLYH